MKHAIYFAVLLVCAALGCRQSTVGPSAQLKPPRFSLVVPHHCSWSAGGSEACDLHIAEEYAFQVDNRSQYVVLGLITDGRLDLVSHSGKTVRQAMPLNVPAGKGLWVALIYDTLPSRKWIDGRLAEFQEGDLAAGIDWKTTFEADEIALLPFAYHNTLRGSPEWSGLAPQDVALRTASAMRVLRSNYTSRRDFEELPRVMRQLTDCLATTATPLSDELAFDVARMLVLLQMHSELIAFTEDASSVPLTILRAQSLCLTGELAEAHQQITNILPRIQLPDERYLALSVLSQIDIHRGSPRDSLPLLTAAVDQILLQPSFTSASAVCAIMLLKVHSELREEGMAAALAQRLAKPTKRIELVAPQSLLNKLTHSLTSSSQGESAKRILLQSLANNERAPGDHLLAAVELAIVESLMGNFSLSGKLLAEVEPRVETESRFLLPQVQADLLASIAILQFYNGWPSKAARSIRRSLATYENQAYRGVHFIDSKFIEAYANFKSADFSNAQDSLTAAIQREQELGLGVDQRPLSWSYLQSLLHAVDGAFPAAEKELTAGLEVDRLDRSLEVQIFRVQALCLRAHLRRRLGLASAEQDMGNLVAGLSAPRVRRSPTGWLGTSFLLSHDSSPPLELLRKILRIRHGTTVGEPQVPDGAAAYVGIVRYLQMDGHFDLPDCRARPVYDAFVLDGAGQCRRISLGDAVEIDQALRAWRDRLSRGERGRSEAARVGELVWAPIAEQISSKPPLIYLSADGALGVAPWEAIPTSGGRMLLDDVAVVRVPDGSILVRSAAASAGQRPLKMLAVGEVDYGAAEPRCWSPLPGTRREIEAIRSLQPAATVLVGSEASKHRVLAELQADTGIVHFATHGLYQPEISDDRLRDAVFSSQILGIASADTLQATAIVLAGANHNAMLKSGPGYLTAREISELNLNGMELAVLSACDTGIGKLVRGEGLASLQRAFHTAGARNVVATLWKVDDQAAALLMGLFYEKYWRDGLAPPAALRAAQLELRDSPRRVAAALASRGPAFAEGPKRIDEVLGPDYRGQAPAWIWAGFCASTIAPE